MCPGGSGKVEEASDSAWGIRGDFAGEVTVFQHSGVSICFITFFFFWSHCTACMLLDQGWIRTPWTGSTNGVLATGPPAKPLHLMHLKWREWVWKRTRTGQSPRTLEASYQSTNSGRKPHHPVIGMLFSPPLSMLSLCLFELSPSI